MEKRFVKLIFAPALLLLLSGTASSQMAAQKPGPKEEAAPYQLEGRWKLIEAKNESQVFKFQKEQQTLRLKKTEFSLHGGCPAGVDGKYTLTPDLLLSGRAGIIHFGNAVRTRELCILPFSFWGWLSSVDRYEFESTSTLILYLKASDEKKAYLRLQLL